MKGRHKSRPTLRSSRSSLCCPYYWWAFCWHCWAGSPGADNYCKATRSSSHLAGSPGRAPPVNRSTAPHLRWLVWAGVGQRGWANRQTSRRRRPIRQLWWKWMERIRAIGPPVLVWFRGALLCSGMPTKYPISNWIYVLNSNSSECQKKKNLNIFSIHLH